MIDFSGLIGRGVVEQDSGLACLERWLRRITLSWYWLPEQLSIECGRLGHVIDLDRRVVHPACVKESCLLRTGFRGRVAQLFPRLVRPDLYTGAIGIEDKEADIRFADFQAQVFEHVLHAGRVEIFNAEGEMIDALGFAKRGRRDRYIARAKAQVTTRRPAIFQDFIAEETTVEQRGFVDVSDCESNMIHTRYAEKPFLRASPHYRCRAERKERVAPSNPIKPHASSLVPSATCLD